jgi:hypothetical protein
VGLYYRDNSQFRIKTNFSSGYSAHIGLEIMLKAMAMSDITVRIMDLAVDLNEHHAFIKQSFPSRHPPRTH